MLNLFPVFEDGALNALPVSMVGSLKSHYHISFGLFVIKLDFIHKIIFKSKYDEFVKYLVWTGK